MGAKTTDPPTLLTTWVKARAQASVYLASTGTEKSGGVAVSSEGEDTIQHGSLGFPRRCNSVDSTMTLSQKKHE